MNLSLQGKLLLISGEVNEEDADSPIGNKSDKEIELEAKTENVDHGKDEEKSVGKGSVAVGDWVVVMFSMEQQVKRTRKFIGKVTEIIEDGELFRADFVNEKYSRDHPGYLFTYPTKKCSDTFSLAEIVRKLDPPKVILRGSLLFNVLLSEC